MSIHDIESLEFPTTGMWGVRGETPIYTQLKVEGAQGSINLSGGQIYQYCLFARENQPQTLGRAVTINLAALFEPNNEYYQDSQSFWWRTFARHLNKSLGIYLPEWKQDYWAMNPQSPEKARGFLVWMADLEKKQY